MASGSHYASPKELPVVCGVDGVGTLQDGKRVFFGGPRRPFGSMAERTVAPEAFCFPIPDALDDATAAALPNPGVSAFMVLTHNHSRHSWHPTPRCNKFWSGEQTAS